MLTIKSFTLLELLIVMLISTMLVAIGYNALNIAQKAYLHFYSDNRETFNTKLLLATLKSDFEGAEIVTCSGDEIVCARGGSRISYKFVNGTAVRSTDNREEIFVVNTLEIRYFQGAIEVRPIRQPVEHIELSLEMNGEKLVYPLSRSRSYYDTFIQWSRNQ